MHVHDYLAIEGLRLLAKAIAEKRVWLRDQAVILAAGGRSVPEIAMVPGCSVRAVQAY